MLPLLLFEFTLLVLTVDHRLEVPCFLLLELDFCNLISFELDFSTEIYLKKLCVSLMIKRKLYTVKLQDLMKLMDKVFRCYIL